MDVVYLLTKIIFMFSYSILVIKLMRYGLDWWMITWLESYLNHQPRGVVVSETKSSWQVVVNGITQGSILGPTSLNVSINNLKNGIKYTPHKTADDKKMWEAVSKLEGGLFFREI